MVRTHPILPVQRFSETYSNVTIIFLTGYYLHMLYFGFVQAPIHFVVKLVQLPTYLIKKRLSSYNRNGLTSHFWPTHDVNKIQ